jgi:cytosine/creatinine deaminase
MLEVFREATRILHLDHPVADWPAAVAATPAEIMGLRGFGKLKRAALANLVIFRGRSWTELLSRPESDRIVVRSGRAIERALPDYSELDDLMVA